jgi:hypothetical protein
VDTVLCDPEDPSEKNEANQNRRKCRSPLMQSGEELVHVANCFFFEICKALMQLRKGR